MLVYEVLPKLQQEIRSEALAQAIGEHLEQTRGHVTNVENAFRSVGVETSSVRSAPADALKQSHDETAEKIADAQLRDLFHAAAAIHTEHFEIAAYDGVLELAEALDATDARKLLDANRAEELAALATLTKVAPRLRKELAS